MKQLRSFVAFALAVALTACDSSADREAHGERGAAGASAAAPGASGAPGASVASGPVATGRCTPGIPPTSQIPRLLNRQYEAVVRDLLGVKGLGADNKPVSQLLVADSDGPMTPDAWRIYQDVAAQIARAVMSGPNKAKFIDCDPAATGCIERSVRSFGRKAFRRPLTEAEVMRFQKLSQTMPAGTADEIAETTLLAFLVSPSFLLVPELSTTPDPSGVGIRLSSYEVAARLSFLLWDSIPDDALNAAADANQLQTKQQIQAQAQRMLAVRERSGPLIASFHRDWAQMKNDSAHWWKVEHDTKIFPLYSAQAKPSLQAELDAFFQEVAFAGGSFADLLLSDVAFVNKQTAALYGLDPAKYGADLTKVTLDAAERPGFMTRAGFLSSYANFDATSPILRGAYIAVYMLGVNPGPPLPGATSMMAAGDFKTQRAYVEALTKQSPCSGCHVIINPPGFVLERFDAIGKLQTTDPRGGAIDATVTTADVQLGSSTQTIGAPRELMQAIARTPKARQLYAQAWVSYAFGRDPNDNDQCVVDELNQKLAQDGYGILALVGDLTQADSFQRRVRSAP